ncbi:hypothetical protein I2I05_00370 [Hymenobacter sp. BT683]|uniref:CBM-cenC domain-containing protein n=1 Tax=Hymenobacter jeongseonensis TaxID=2791027 RepID=A0ABS0ICZ5_9BACT|nr:hypothetical protein [Hymenobacter jeongseonensis]MBF9235838.1 hypothetical protein [Hymenobacter jeongseonensis]
MNNVVSYGRRLALLGLLALVAPACSTDKGAAADSATVVHNDFDNLAGWLGAAPTPTLTTEKAHSGQYAIKVDANNEFSLGFSSTLGNLQGVRINKLKLTAWVFVPNGNATALLVTHVGDQPPATKPVLWDGFDVTQAVGNKYNQWVEISKVVEIPKNATATDNIGFFLWRTSVDQPVYLDDFSVSIVK